MTEVLPPGKKISLNIPFPSAETAAFAYDVLKVDKELKGCGIRRELSTDGLYLLIDFYGTDLKKLRVTLNTIIKNIILIVKTIDQFGNI